MMMFLLSFGIYQVERDEESYQKILSMWIYPPGCRELEDRGISFVSLKRWMKKEFVQIKGKKWIHFKMKSSRWFPKKDEKNVIVVATFYHSWANLSMAKLAMSSPFGLVHLTNNRRLGATYSDVGSWSWRKKKAGKLELEPKDLDSRVSGATVHGQLTNMSPV